MQSEHKTDGHYCHDAFVKRRRTSGGTLDRAILQSMSHLSMFSDSSTIVSSQTTTQAVRRQKVWKDQVASFRCSYFSRSPSRHSALALHLIKYYCATQFQHINDLECSTCNVSSLGTHLLEWDWSGRHVQKLQSQAHSFTIVSRLF